MSEQPENDPDFDEESLGSTEAVPDEDEDFAEDEPTVEGEDA